MNNKDLINIFDFNKYINIVKCLQNDFTDIIFFLCGERGRFSMNYWFSHDVTKNQTTKLSTILRFYFHGVLEQLKTNFQTTFRFKRVLGFVIVCA